MQGFRSINQSVVFIVAQVSAASIRQLVYAATVILHDVINDVILPGALSASELITPIHRSASSAVGPANYHIQRTHIS